MSERNARRAANAAKKHPVLVSAVIAAILVIFICALLLWFFKPDLVKRILGIEEENAPPQIEYGMAEEINGAEFSIHFLDVGNKYTGDCVLIDCGDTEVLIDAGSRKSSAPTLVRYIDRFCADGKLEYVIATHSDQDHISAFMGESKKNNGIFSKYEIGTFIMFDKSGKDPAETKLYGEFLQAAEDLREKGTSVFTASQCYDEKDGASRQYYLNETNTLSLNILYNYYYYNVDKNNENNHSVVTLLTYEGQTEISHYLFTGDLEEKGESELVKYYKNPANSKSKYDVLPEVELFKAGHHGSYTASGEELLEMIKPKYVAVCCCAGSKEYADNPAHYFPAQEFIDRAGKYTDKIYCTNVVDGNGYSQMNGNIVFYFAGSLKLYCSQSPVILKDSEWFKANRTWNGV